MKKKLKHIAVIIAGVALLILLGCASDDNLEAPPPGKQPDLTDLIDFSIELAEITDTNTPFSAFSSQPLLIFYYSPYCPHCQATYSGVQQLANEYEQHGLAFIAIAIGGASEQDLLQFIEQYAPGAANPFFQDTEGKFGKKYGDGYVPRVYLVFQNKEYIRYTNAYSEGLKEVRDDLDNLFGIEK
jgi:thiol-disulfide isomerase/thioredoxin